MEIALGVIKGDIYPFIYNKTYPFVFYSLCQSGIIVSSAHTYLQLTHEKTVAVMQRYRAAYTLMLLPGIVWKETELNDYQGPVSIRKAILYLRRPKTDGLKCNKCSYIYCNARLMQHYCRTEHGLVSKQRVRALSRAARQRKFQVLWQEGVKCQRLFKKRKLSQWFKVCNDEALQGGEAASLGN